MALEGELPQDEEEQLASPRVLAGGELEDDWHESAGVLDANGLRGEVSEDRGFMEKQNVMEGVRRGHWAGWGTRVTLAHALAVSSGGVLGSSNALTLALGSALTLRERR
jgi:hypothetical protein